MNTQTSQSKRFEDKYSIQDKALSGILSYLKRFGKSDIHSDNQGSYIVQSLYFDTDNLKTYHDYKNGKTKRFKVRVRSYNHEAFSKLEYKFKENRLSYKVTEPWNGELGTMIPRIPDLRQYRLSPVLYTRYRRYAFDMDGFRVTLDTEIGFAKFILSSEPLYRQIKKKILEIKGMGDYPDSVRKLLTDYNLKRESISKYATAVEELNLD